MKKLACILAVIAATFLAPAVRADPPGNAIEKATVAETPARRWHDESYPGATKKRTDHLFVLALAAVIALFIYYTVRLGAQKRKQGQAETMAMEGEMGMPATYADGPFVNIAMLDGEVQAEALHAALMERGIPHLMKNYRDSAYDGLFQAGHGWGHVEAPEGRRADVLQAIKDISIPPDESAPA